MALTIGGTSVNPGSWSSAVQSGLGAVASGGSNVEGITKSEAKAALADIQQTQTPQGQAQPQQQGIVGLQSFEQANPVQQNQFLNQIQPKQAAAMADQAQMAGALGLGTNAVPKEVQEAYASGQAFREKRAAQVEKGAKGSDVIYREGVKSPIYSENISKAEAQGGNVFIGGVGSYTYAPQPATPTSNIVVSQPREQLFSPITQGQLNEIQTRREFAAANAPGVVGGASLASGGWMTLSQGKVVPQPQEETPRSLFKLEPAVNEGNIRLRENIAGAAEYGFEKFVSFAPIPRGIKEPIIGFGKGLVGSVASGTVLISPLGIGEAIGTIGNKPQQQKLIVEFAGAAAFGGIVGKAMPIKTTIPQYSVSSTGYASFSLRPIGETSTRFTVAKTPESFVVRSTTDVPIGSAVVQGGRVVGEYPETGLITRTATPFTAEGKSFMKVQEVSQMAGKTKVQQFAMQIEENVPSRQFVSAPANLFSLAKTFPTGPTFSTQKVEGGVLFNIGKDFVYRTSTSDMASGGAFKPGFKVYVADEFGKVSGVSELPVNFREPPIGAAPGKEAKFVAPGNYKVQIFREQPKQTMGIPRDITMVEYSKVEGKPTTAKTPSGGQKTVQVYDIRSYDKPISASEIQAGIPSTTRAVAGETKIMGRVSLDIGKFEQATQEKPKEFIKFDIGGMTADAAATQRGRFVSLRGISPSFNTGITAKTTPTQTIIGSILQPSQSAFPTSPTFAPIPRMSLPPETPYKRRLELPEVFFPDMSGETGIGGKYKKPKGKYQPSFIALQLGILGAKEKPLKVKASGLLGGGKKIKDGAGILEASGFAIRPIIGGKKRK